MKRNRTGMENHEVNCTNTLRVVKDGSLHDPGWTDSAPLKTAPFAAQLAATFRAPEHVEIEEATAPINSSVCNMMPKAVLAQICLSLLAEAAELRDSELPELEDRLQAVESALQIATGVAAEDEERRTTAQASLREELACAEAAQESGEKNQEHLAAELQSSKLALAELTARLEEADLAQKATLEAEAPMGQTDKLETQDVQAQAQLEELREELCKAEAAQESGEKHQEHLAAELQSSKLALAELTARLEEADLAQKATLEAEAPPPCRGLEEALAQAEGTVAEATQELASSKRELVDLRERFEDVEYALQIASEAAAEDGGVDGPVGVREARRLREECLALQAELAHAQVAQAQEQVEGAPGVRTHRKTADFGEGGPLKELEGLNHSAVVKMVSIEEEPEDQASKDDAFFSPVEDASEKSRGEGRDRAVSFAPPLRVKVEDATTSDRNPFEDDSASEETAHGEESPVMIAGHIPSGGGSFGTPSGIMPAAATATSTQDKTARLQEQLSKEVVELRQALRSEEAACAAERTKAEASASAVVEVQGLEGVVAAAMDEAVGLGAPVEEDPHVEHEHDNQEDQEDVGSRVDKDRGDHLVHRQRLTVLERLSASGELRGGGDGSCGGLGPRKLVRAQHAICSFLLVAGLYDSSAVILWMWVRSLSARSCVADSFVRPSANWRSDDTHVASPRISVNLSRGHA
eukprot:s4885_g8.t1